MQRRTLMLIVAGLAGLAVLSCGGCLILGALLPSTPTPTPVSVALAGPKVTVTPKPSATPLPTATPKPSATPRPTATVKPQPPVTVQLYAIEIQRKLQPMAEALTTLGELTQAAQIGNDSWTLQLAAQMAIIKRGHEEISTMEAIPAEMTDVHATMVSATTDLDQAMDHLATGLDNLNATEIEVATALMQSGNTKIDKARQLLEDYMAQFE